MKRYLMFGFLAVLMVSLIWVGCNPDQGPTAPEGDATVESAAKSSPIGAAIAAQNRHTNDLLGNPEVVGTAVGHGGDGRPVVLVLARSGGVAGIPRSLDGIPVQVRVTGEIHALKHKPGHDKGPGGGGEDPPSEPSPTDRWPECVK